MALEFSVPSQPSAPDIPLALRCIEVFSTTLILRLFMPRTGRAGALSYPIKHPDSFRIFLPKRQWRAWHNATSEVACPKHGKLKPATNYCLNLECKARMRGMMNPLFRVRQHDFRHSAVIRMLDHRMPISTVPQLLARSASKGFRMAKRYGHIRPESQPQALESVATALPGVPEGEQQTCFRGVHQIGNQASRVEQFSPFRPVAQPG